MFVIFGYYVIHDNTVKTVMCFIGVPQKPERRFLYSSEWHIPVNVKHLYNICTMLDQRRRRWADIVQMLCKCSAFTGIQHTC